MTNSKLSFRPIRSYVLRQGRMSDAQLGAHRHYWSEFGLDLTATPFDFDHLFNRQAQRILEIGFGMGDSLIALAKNFPEADFIGIEVHPPGVGRCLLQAKLNNLSNLKLFNKDAVQVLEHCIPDQSLDKVLLLFPDPWPKKKHHKRRLVQPDFVALVAKKLKIGGQFHLATDWQPYADHMLSVLEASVLQNQFPKQQFAPSQFERITTKFETRGLKLGHQIWDLVYIRVSAANNA
ncbi:MAG: tRNA (guanosine(46)-N7)-methyltransferase TrmB [Proteobacteria bacterium]|nr:tRNA (guanosine(46)-N7)-methyltransferase TrmB [Pseudomonadota bacterium]